MSHPRQHLRAQYEQEGLRQADVWPDPVAQFATWFAAAAADDLPQVDAMTLATATPDGRPSARLVLLKRFDERGFVFFTHYQSRKGQELALNPWAALVFYWYDHHRQVRIEGVVVPLPSDESDKYFATRPRPSQIGAWASAQSEPVRGRGQLDSQYQQYQAQFSEQEISRPPFWGGYCLQPVTFEFWQGQSHRFHDRICYRLTEEGNWILQRLSP